MIFLLSLAFCHPERNNCRKKNIRWNGTHSNGFKVKNGLRQGGVASPLFYSVYMDELLDRLKKCVVGCYIINCFVGALSYADDLTLMAPTLKGLQVMLNECVNYAEEYSVTYNSKKTVCIKFDSRPALKRLRFKPCCVVLSNEELIWHSKVKHLGSAIPVVLSALIAAISSETRGFNEAALTNSLLLDGINTWMAASMVGPSLRGPRR